jgi:hypothetical protein
LPGSMLTEVLPIRPLFAPYQARPNLRGRTAETTRAQNGTRQ